MKILISFSIYLIVMGIKDLHTLIKRYANSVYHEVKLSKYKFLKIAVDVSLYLFKYKAIMGNRWLSGFIEMISALRKNSIHPIFVYDNKPPKAKEKEKEKRRNTREKMSEKILVLEQDLKEFHNTAEISQNLIDFYNTRKKNEQVARLLDRGGAKTQINIQFVESELEKMKSQMISITKEDISLTKELCDVIGIPHILAQGEAEKECAEMCKSGVVSAVMSEDTDVLAYGAPVFLTKFTTNSKKSGEGSFVEIKLENVLNCLELSYPSFLDLCIMCGCDYNSNVRGIGAIGAYKLIKEHENIEKIKKNIKKDVSVLNYEECRELFTTSKYKKKIGYNSFTDKNKFQEFILVNNIKINIERILSCLEPNNCVVE